MLAVTRRLVLAFVFVGGGVVAQPAAEIDPAALLATDDYFGWKVDVSADYALIGAYRASKNGVRSGVAFVYAWTETGWVLDGTLVPDDAAADDLFGAAVSLSGDRALVGAFANGDDGALSGSAYVFVRTASGWEQEAKLTASDAEAGDYFGYALSLSGDRALVGALADDDEGTDSGAAYVFVRSGTTWTEEVKLTALDADVDDFFGFSVSLSGDRALIGAYRDDDGGDRTGSAYVFVRSGTTWSQEAKLTASDAQPVDLFGRAVSLSGDRALVGSYFNDNPARKSGAAYVFARSGSTWTEEAKLAPDDRGIDQEFGISVAISGDRALVGSRRAGLGPGTGAAYVFARTGATWAQEADLFAPRLDSLHALGQSVAISGDRVLVGAPGASDDGDRSGAVYSFARVGAHWSVDARLIRPAVTPYVSTVIDGRLGLRYLGPPASGVTVDDLAAQNLVRGVTGYYPGARAPNLWTTFDAASNTWAPAAGTGEELALGRAFRWQMYDRAQGNPRVSVGVEFPFVLTTDRPANTTDVTVELDTAGTRFTYLANPFATDLDLTGIASWPGGTNVSPNAPVWVWDPETRLWVDAPAAIGPWEAFRVKAKGPRTNGAARTLTIPAWAAGLAARPAALVSDARLPSPEAETVTLLPVAPNPSVGGARVAFELSEPGTVRLTVLDVQGRTVAVLADGAVAAGRHEARLSATLAAGVYVVRLEAAGQVVARRAVVAR